MSRLRAVFFDIDDTLYSTTKFAARARRNAVEAMRRFGLRLPAECVLKELAETVREFSSNYEHHFDKLLLRLPTAAYEGVNPSILVAAAVSAYHQTKATDLKPFPDAVDLLRALAKTDLVRGVVSDGLQVKQAEKIVRLGIYELLTPTAIFISDQIGISKPNPKLFQRACAEIGIAARETMYVGNSPTHDVDPANAAGMIAVLCARADAKRNHIVGKSKPRYTVKNFHELADVIRGDFKLALERDNARAGRRR